MKDRKVYTLDSEEMEIKNDVINALSDILDGYFEEYNIESVKYKKESEFIKIWEQLRKKLILRLRSHKFGGHKWGFIHYVNEEVKNIISSERYKFVELNGGYGSFWGSKNNLFNHSQ